MLNRDRLPIDLATAYPGGRRTSPPNNLFRSVDGAPLGRRGIRRNFGGGRRRTMKLRESRRPHFPTRPTRLFLSTLFLLSCLLVQGVAYCATSVTTYVPARYSVTHAGAPPAPPASVTGSTEVRVTAAQAGLRSAGTQQAGAVGMAGTPTMLPSCGAATCHDRYIVASPAGLTVNDYAERVTFGLTQPAAPPGVSTGFLVEIAVDTSSGWFVGRAYLATGTTAVTGGSAITLSLFLSFGTATAPTILSIKTVVDTCSSSTVCP
jgi:hypothetical protein